MSEDKFEYWHKYPDVAGEIMGFLYLAKTEDSEDSLTYNQISKLVTALIGSNKKEIDYSLVQMEDNNVVDRMGKIYSDKSSYTLSSYGFDLLEGNIKNLRLNEKGKIFKPHKEIKKLLGI